MRNRRKHTAPIALNSLDEDCAPRTAFVDPSPLILDQFTRNRDGSNPAGEAESMPRRRSSSYRSTHMHDEDEGY